MQAPRPGRRLRPSPRTPPTRSSSTPSCAPRVVSGEKVGEFIHEADAYAAGPDQLTGQFLPATAGDGEEAWYFFTTLKLKGKH
jgi:hypothetical protein